MKGNNLKIFWLLFKFILLFQLYSHLKFTTEASKISQTRKNVIVFEENDGTNNLNDRMSTMEEKINKQENEISQENCFWKQENHPSSERACFKSRVIDAGQQFRNKWETIIATKTTLPIATIAHNQVNKLYLLKKCGNINVM